MLHTYDSSNFAMEADGYRHGRRYSVRRYFNASVRPEQKSCEHVLQ